MAVKTFFCLCIVIFLLVEESRNEQAGVDHNTFLSRNIQDTNIPSARFSSFSHRTKRHYGYGMGGWGMPYGGYRMGGWGMPYGGYRMGGWGMPYGGYGMGMPFGGFGMPFMGFG